MEKSLTVTVPLEISLNLIADTLTSALEGGSNYWYDIDQFIEPPTGNLFKWSNTPDNDHVYRHIQYPVSVGGALIITVTEAVEGDDHFGKKFRLDLDSIKTGLALMAAKAPAHFGNMISENGDAETGDVFLQYCLFGDLIYG